MRLNLTHEHQAIRTLYTPRNLSLSSAFSSIATLLPNCRVRRLGLRNLTLSPQPRFF